MRAPPYAFFSPGVCGAVLVIISSFLLNRPAVAAADRVHAITLPAETAALRPSELPGYTIALQKCGICHSADYINLQPPSMSLSQWTAEMTKMQHAYGAPIDETEIKLLGVYFATIYGDANTANTGDAARPVVPTLAAAAAQFSNIDVQAVLAHNGCLGCHASKQKIVGPAYHDVATQYRSNASASATLAANIQAGGSGRWGEVPMPPFPKVSPAELQALAEFVLAQ